MNMFKSLRRGDRGQILMLAALLLPVLLGMAGMAVDIGTYTSERRTLQNAADAIALAAAQELPDPDDTRDAADAWAAKNGIDAGTYQVIITGGTIAPAVQVIISESHEFAFVRAIGIDDADVGGKAKAVKVSLGGMDGIVPWAVEDSTVGSVPLGQEIIIKYDSNNSDNGNFGPIRVDGSGNSDYADAAMFGSDSAICAEGTSQCVTSGCPGAFPEDCGETAPECDGEECAPKTGNMVGGTRDAVDHRVNYTSSNCDTFEEVFTDPDNDGTHTLDGDCNPWAGPGKCESTTELCSRRVFIIPVIDEYPNGSSSPVTILRFALVFLEGYDGGKCQGSSCEIRARFVKAELTTGGLSGVYSDDALIKFVRLTE
jgi:hypothetical protein